ncbi:hypothetical protein M758_11G095400 [Ceratodon purpureus]|nr:hypothetical protein M758_11G095400 [Ceratodon purpureus]
MENQIALHNASNACGRRFVQEQEPRLESHLSVHLLFQQVLAKLETLKIVVIPSMNNYETSDNKFQVQKIQLFNTDMLQSNVFFHSRLTHNPDEFQMQVFVNYSNFSDQND